MHKYRIHLVSMYYIRCLLFVVRVVLSCLNALVKKWE